MGIKDYPALIGEFFRILKPGGFLQLQEWDFFAVDVEKRVIGAESYFGQWCSALRHGLAYRGAGVNAANSLNEMVAGKGFGAVQQRDVWMPIGPCFPRGLFDLEAVICHSKTTYLDTADGVRLNLVGEFMRENVKVGFWLALSIVRVIKISKAFIKVGRALIIGSGMASDEYDHLAQEATKEVHDISLPLFLRLHCITARK
ncbi:hypothetical protein C0992_012833 [Termitomyces sp. T32_za158]|nr:hypothetical protein C0992_012833 [Termitomyces sp. T32_za158]